MSRFATLGRTAPPGGAAPPPPSLEERRFPPARQVALAAASTTLAGAAAFTYGALLEFFPRSGLALLAPVAAMAMMMDRVRQRIYWPVLAPLLTNPSAVQELSLLPNPSGFLVAWVRRADTSIVHHMQTRTPHFAALLCVLLSFHADSRGIVHVALVSVLCTLSWFATRVVLHRQVEALREVDILGATRRLVGLAAKSAGVPIPEQMRAGRPPRAIVAFSPMLVVLFIAVAVVLIRVDSTSDALAAFALVLLPATFPLAVAFSRPRVHEMQRTSEAEANRLIADLGRRVAERDLSAG